MVERVYRVPSAASEAVFAVVGGTPSWGAGTEPLALINDLEDSRTSYLQFVLAIDTGAVIASAKLRLVASSDTPDLGEDLEIALLDRFATSLATSAVIDAQLAEITPSAGEFEDGEVVEYDVTDLVAAALADDSYSPDGFVTLRLAVTSEVGQTARTFLGYGDGVSDPLRTTAPTLIVEYTAPTPAVDPLTQIYLALWDMLESDAEFAATVKPGNRIKYTDPHRDPEKPQISAADLPEVAIRLASTTPHALRTSNSSSVKATWVVEVATGERSMTGPHLRLYWCLFRIFADLARSLGGISYGGNPLIASAVATATSHGLTDRDLNRGVAGWSTVWTIETETFVRTADL